MSGITNKFAWLCGTCAIALSCETPAYAQVGGQAEANQIETVTVTAQRRSENQQTVPIAITALSSEQIAERQITAPSDLTKSVPSLNYNSIFGYATPYLRGVGSSNVSIGDEPSVATYVDGVYQISGAVSAGLPLNNVDHIEVLDGPQGTLYGRNATGGLINIITKEPTDTFSSVGSIGYGNYSTVQGNAYVSDGITDGISADVAVRFQHQGDGYIHNDYDGKDIGTDNFFSVRSKWRFELGAHTTLDLSADYANDSNSYATTAQNYPGSVPLTALVPGTTFSDTPWHTTQVVDPIWRVHEYGFSAKFTTDFGSADFVSITSYRHVIQENNLANDISSADGPLSVTSPDPRIGTVLLPALYDKETQTTPFGYTQEFQLLSNDNSRFSWIGGVFLLDTRVQYDPLLLYYSTKAPSPLITFGGPGQSARAIGLYGQSSYEITDSLKITGGLRYSGEQRTMQGYEDIPLFQVAATTDKSTIFQGLSYHFAIDDQLFDQLMVYASDSRGFKSGLYNGSAIDDSPAVKPEILDDYEIGFKSDPTPTIRLNGSAFFYNYRDKQEFGIAPNGTGSLASVPSSQMYGLDLSADVLPFDGLKLGAGLSLEHSEYLNYPNAEVYVPSTPVDGYPNAGYAIISRNVKGNQMERTPDLTFNLNADYTWDLQTLGNLVFDGNFYHTSKFAWDPSDLYWQNAYNLFDASVTWNDESGKWNVSVWGKNLTNEAYGSALVIGQRSLGEAYAPPRTFGFTVGWKVE